PRSEVPGQGQTYGQISARDVQTWSRESPAMAANGSRVFHDANELGSTIAVSCDMCHPNAANTHPETYPKFPVQRPALTPAGASSARASPVRGNFSGHRDERAKFVIRRVHASWRHRGSRDGGMESFSPGLALAGCDGRMYGAEHAGACRHRTGPEDDHPRCDSARSARHNDRH